MSATRIAMAASAWALGCVMASVPARAGEPSLGVSAGLLGLGAEAGYSFNERFAARVAAYTFSYSYDGEESGIEYDSDLDLSSAAAYLDWHPRGGVFRVTGGLFANGNEVNAVASPDATGTYDIGGATFTSAQVGRLAGSAEFDSVAPYLGVGWRSRGGADGGLGFSVDLGVLFQGSPDVELTSTGGTLSGDPMLQDALDEEERDVEDDVDQYEFYPVINLGIGYTF
jgi:hypothetical protein